MKTQLLHLFAAHASRAFLQASFGGEEERSFADIARLAYDFAEAMTAESFRRDVAVTMDDEPKPAPLQDVQAVFRFHKKVMNERFEAIAKRDGTAPVRHKDWRLTTSLRAKIRTRLQNFTVRQLNKASGNLSLSDWHMGLNPNKQLYCEPKWLFYNHNRTEKWLNNDTKGQPKRGYDGAVSADEQHIVQMQEKIAKHNKDTSNGSKK